MDELTTTKLADNIVRAKEDKKFWLKYLAVCDEDELPLVGSLIEGLGQVEIHAQIVYVKSVLRKAETGVDNS